MIFTVRLFPEITLKSNSVRKRWTKILTQNIRALVSRIDEQIKVLQDWDKITVRAPDTLESLESQVVDVLSRVPGVAYFSRVSQFSFESIDDISEQAFTLWKNDVVGKTFCVRVKRTGKHAFTSTDLERHIGAELFHGINTGGVKLKNPDITLNIEVKDGDFYLVKNKFQGLGGFPMGTQEPVISLISGGFDSTVASYMMMRRGIKTHYCFFNLGGKEHERAVKELAFYIWHRYSSTHRVKFVTVNFEPLMAEILEKVKPSNMGVILKRMMLRAAEKVSYKGNVQAIVTGEAVAQVSSQTIHNLAAIDQVSNKLVLRPLVVMDKPDIIKLARDIGTEEFSANIPEYCGVISVKPSAKVNFDNMLAEESLINLQVLEDAVLHSTVETIDELASIGLEASVSIYEGVIPQNAVIVDIRHHLEQEAKPLNLENILIVPFYKLSYEIELLDKSKEYLLYCEKGVMSKIHASDLVEKGFHNVGIYRKT